jgi:hypothetical protein
MKNNRERLQTYWKLPLAKMLEKEKLIKAGFEFVRYSDKEGVGIYRKRK